MRKPIALLLLGFIATLSHAENKGGATSGKLPKDIRPESYLIHLEPNTEELITDGVESIKIEVLNPTNRIVLNAVGIEISAARIAHGETQEELIPQLDAERRIVVLAGLHAGCYELFVREKIREIGDLKGKTIAVSEFNSSEHVFISSMVAYVGMDPRKDLHWLTARTTSNAMQSFVEGKADAFLAFPPEPQELRAMKIGRVMVNTTLDRPWSQYFCCMVFASREFVERNPIATKRTLRAILKAADICAVDPESAARYLVAKGYEPRHEIGLEVLKSLPYARWRQSNPEDTLRFHALRLHEFGMIKSSPQKLIAQGTDWRFLNELKWELKA